MMHGPSQDEERRIALRLRQRPTRRRIFTKEMSHAHNRFARTQCAGRPGNSCRRRFARRTSWPGRQRHHVQGRARVEDGALIIENAFHAKGGPARHLHFEQDEWFYVAEGAFRMEVGDTRYELRAGDSLLAPRNVPHVWAHVGDGTGRMLITFLPAGKMEAFFRIVTQANAMPPQDPQLWRGARHGACRPAAGR